MSKRKKVKKTGSRSASAANRVAKTQDTSFVKRPSIAKPQSEERKEGFGVLKKLIFVFVVLIIGASVLANFTGSNKSERGDGEQDAPCVGSEDCVAGHVCYAYGENPITCKERCATDDDCSENHSCKPVARFGKKRVRPMTVCIQNSELK